MPMTQVQEIPNEVKAVGASSVKLTLGRIVQGDENQRFHLVGEKGNTLVLASDLYENHFLADPLCRAMKEAEERQQQFNDEAQLLFQVVDKWKFEHKDRIDENATKIADAVLVSASGKARFQFIVVPLEGQEDFLENELVNLDSRILNDSTYRIVRLDSLLM